MYRNDEVWMAKSQENIEQAKRYVRFCAKIYEHQREAGRYFLHEHPWLATSWSLPEIDKLLCYDDVQRVRTDMCQFGMTSRQGGIGSALGPVLKPTGFLTNSKCIAKELSQRCTRDHEHVPLVGGRAAAAAIYPHKLCAAICKGLAAQIRADDGLRIETPLMNSNGLRKLSQACQEATSPEANALFFDPIESGETHESDTQTMIDRTLDAVFANRYSSLAPPLPKSPERTVSKH